MTSKTTKTELTEYQKHLLEKYPFISYIGYGGNDGSLMGFLKKLEPPVPDRIYWCTRVGSPPNARVMDLLEKRNGVLVTIAGFDEIMLGLKNALDIPDLLPDLEDRHRKRVETYRKKFSELTKDAKASAQAPGATPDAKALGAAADAAVEQLQKEDTPDSWILRAESESDNAKAESIYREALEKHPRNGALMAAFGKFLADERQAFDEAEKLIKSAYDADPENADRMQDYGTFLWKCRSDGKRAEPLLCEAVRRRTDSLGAEHPAVLKSRNNLANAMGSQGKKFEAEQEHRAVLKLSERVLGVEHPSTLASRSNLAEALRVLGKYAEAEQENRLRIKIEERVLGAEHPDTLVSWNNLAITLQDQGKDVEAEQVHRAVLKVRERVLVAEHPDVFQSCYNLALCLEDQKKLNEALEFMQRAEEGWAKVLGADHPDAKDAKKVRERIEAALKVK